MGLNENECWRALDTVTGEMCPHHHHTTTTAKRCGNRTFHPHKVKAVKWEPDFKPTVYHCRGRKREAMRDQVGLEWDDDLVEKAKEMIKEGRI